MLFSVNIHIFQIQLFNKSEADILELLCNPEKMENILRTPGEFTPINVTDISQQFCDPEIAAEIKAGIDVSQGMYKVHFLYIEQSKTK